eukprot:TRINITY_DN47622_c0_g1_i1.p1 TRINITY_DN47622_c0_g1~~TRINITY_DN47622_c0_g1_i1.p1  ORF type:complete len:341 (+),score=81.52 TRINITY_DN47622_c0_g1_i1:92-1024(+)
MAAVVQSAGGVTTAPLQPAAGAGAQAAPAAGAGAGGGAAAPGAGGGAAGSAAAGGGGGKAAAAAGGGGAKAAAASSSKAFCGMCPGCGWECCPGCSTVCCIAHDYLICCGATASLVTCGALLACAGGGGPEGEYNQFCGECEMNAAVLECTECHEIYCQVCYDRTHAKKEFYGTRKGHRALRHKPTSVRYLVSEQERQFYMAAEQPCGECSDEDHQVRATVYCLDCKEVYCHGCKVKVHSRGLRVKHTRFVPLCAGEDIVSRDDQNKADTDVLDRHFPPKPPAYERGEARPKWQREEDPLGDEGEDLPPP